jgi:acetolactate decarboxylase
MVVRSVHSQEPPYTTLTAAVATQSVFEWSNVQGDVVSFFNPQYLSGVNVPGFHSHFISNDRKLGGHILRFKGAKLKVEIARIRAVNIVFPHDGQFRTVNLFDIDPNDIHKAEK